MAYGPNATDSPVDQVKKIATSVTDALKNASDRVTAGSKDVGMCALKQAEQNTSRLFETLQGMASAKDPSEVAQLYSQFVTESTKTHAEQLREMGELLAKTSGDVWKPVTNALSAVMPRAGK